MPVVDVLVVVGEVLAVGPPALLAEAAIPMPAPARASTAMIIVVLMSQFCARCTPAGLPGDNAEESANALVLQSARDTAKQMAFFIINSSKGWPNLNPATLNQR